MRAELRAVRAVLALVGLTLAVAPAIGAQEPFVPLGPVEPRLPGLERRIAVSLEGSRAEVLERVAREAGLSLVFAADLPGLDAPIERPVRPAAAREILIELLRGTALELRIAGDRRAVLTRRSAPAADTVPRLILFRGAVHDSATGSPLHLASVVAGTRVAHAGPTGRFQLHAPVGAALSVRAVGYGSRTLDPAAAIGDTVDLGVIRLAREPLRLADVVVSPSTFSTGTAAVSAQVLDRETLERTTQIGEDAYRAINRLPGIENNDNTSAFRVRGGPHDELYVSLDGLTLLEPFHLKDFDNALSILDPQMIGGVELITGGFGAKWGDRLTGVLNFASVDRLPGPERHQIGLSLANVRALGSGGFAGDRGSWLGSVRRGYLDLVLAIADPSSQVRPRYLDAFGKVSYRLSSTWTLSLHGLAARDGLNYQEDDHEPRIDSRYASGYAWARLRTVDAGPWRADVVASLGGLSWTRLGTRLSPFDDRADLFVDDRRDYGVASVRGDLSYEATPWLLLTGGLEARAARADYDYLNWRRSFASTAAGWEERYDSTAVDRRFTGGAVGGYLTARVRPLPSLTLELGGRADHWSETDESVATPKILVAWTPAPRLTLRGAWGRYAQSQGLHRLQVQDGIEQFGPAERSEHLVVGADLMLDARHDARVELYGRRYGRVRPRYVNLDGSQNLFPELNYDRFLLAPSRSEVQGVELSFRGFERSVTWTALYQLQRARDRVAGQWIAREFDQRHAGSVDLGVRLGPRIFLSTAFVFHSGWPYTDASFTVEPLPDGSLVLGRDTGPLNAERLPAYYRLDLRATRDFPISRGRIRAFLELFNLLDRDNQRGFNREPVFAEDGSLASTRVSGEDLYPRLLSFGIYWEF